MKPPAAAQDLEPAAPNNAVDPAWTEEDEEELRHFREMAKLSREVSRRWIDELIKPSE